MFDRICLRLCLVFAIAIIGAGCKKIDQKRLARIETGLVSDISFTEATVIGTYIEQGGFPISSYGHCYSSTNTIPTIDDQVHSFNNTAVPYSYKSNIKNLDPGTTYYARAYSDDGVNISYGDTVTFTTLPDLMNTDWSVGDEWIDIRDSIPYPTIQINDQIWMSKNMAYIPHLVVGATNNVFVYDYLGGSIEEAKTMENYALYGCLYDWEIAVNACPPGWHLPSLEEWNSLINYAGGLSVAGGKLKSSTGWEENGQGTDDLGFGAVPGGYNDSYGSFYFKGTTSLYWTSSKPNNWIANHIELPGYTVEAKLKSNEIYMGFSVRCIKD